MPPDPGWYPVGDDIMYWDGTTWDTDTRKPAGGRPRRSRRFTVGISVALVALAALGTIGLVLVLHSPTERVAVHFRAPCSLAAIGVPRGLAATLADSLDLERPDDSKPYQPKPNHQLTVVNPDTGATIGDGHLDDQGFSVVSNTYSPNANGDEDYDCSALGFLEIPADYAGPIAVQTDAYPLLDDGTLRPSPTDQLPNGRDFDVFLPK